MPERLFIIDGHALIFKMYYAFLRRPMINSRGEDTSILFGFTKYILELIEKEKPTHFAVAFDPPGGSFRNKLYPQYKANRAETPQLVIEALEPLTRICKLLNIPVLMIPGFEADDVIGSAAKRFSSEGLQVYMVTPDKDYGQLIGPGIFQVKPGRNGSENELVGEKEICDRYGIQTPGQVVDILTICGDSADNVPGVTGVGEVWAGKLLARFRTVEGIYEHIDEVSDKQKMMFEAARDHIALSKELVTIKTDIELETSVDDMRVDFQFSPEIVELFDRYEFNSLKRYISHIPASAPAGQAAPARDIRITRVSAHQMVLKICSVGKCAFKVTSLQNIMMATVADTAVADEYVCAEGSIEDYLRVLKDPTVTKYGFDIKKSMALLSGSSVALRGRLFDVELMHYILNPERSHKLEVLAKSYLGIDLECENPVQETLSLFDDDGESMEMRKHDMGREVAAMIPVGIKIWAEMKSAGQDRLYEKMEEPLISVLSKMETTGIKVDIGSLKDFAAMLSEEISEKEELVRSLAGDPSLNVSSPKQIGEVIFEKLKLNPKARKPAKGSWSTDEDTLLELSDKSPIIDAILEFRAAKKLLSTYIEPFSSFISPKDGRVHTTFNQALTATGRLSSSNPNLQNIPIRTERGKEIRKAFISGDPSGLILSADYSQIELRIMAHLSADSHLVSAFNDGEDVHRATAAKIFGVPFGDVTQEQRRIAKTANFGIMYGISAFGLAQRLRIPLPEARKIIDDYFESFPAIASFINETVAAARESLYVETLFGRRRYIPEINSHNANVRALAERNAVNAPIQGTSADIIKMAMIKVDSRLEEEHLKSRMVLQIHDELLFETFPDELEILSALVKEEMEGVIKLSVPLTVECNYGKNWLEAH